METAPLKSFATWARTALLREVSARMSAVLAPGATERVEHAVAITALESAVADAGGGEHGHAHVIDKVAYTWFNRIIALRFMDANRYTGVGVVSPQAGGIAGQPEVLANAKRGVIDSAVVTSTEVRSNIASLLDGSRNSVDPQGEAYALLLEAYCNHWHKAMPFMFEREGDFTELLIPANLLADDSVLSRAVEVLTEEVCQDVEVIGWLYQFYISERKDEVFAGFKKNKKAGAAEIPAATQLFTPHWIVRYLVENSVGRLWMLNHPESQLVEHMDYYVAPVDEEVDFLRISSPEELTVIDPACGSGHMLTYAFDLLYAIYEEEGYSPTDIPGLILEKNIFGTEIDPRAGALAAFALTMKARARQRTILGKGIEPNVCVIESIVLSEDECELLSHAEDHDGSERRFWNQFDRADVFGALIQPESELTSRLSARLMQVEFSNDLMVADALMRARRVLRQAEVLDRKYAVVVANPPYMGSGNMSNVLSSWLGKWYELGKSDLMTAFMLRASSLTSSGGYWAIVDLPSWMVLKSYEKLRIQLFATEFVACLAQFGRGVWGSDFGSVGFVVQKALPAGRRGTYRKLFEKHVDVRSNDEIEALYRDSNYNRYDISQTRFAVVPGSPLVYWLPDKILSAFKRGVALKDVSEPRQGLLTGDSGTFVRHWWEVSSCRFARSCASREQAMSSGARWFPYNKGGEFRKWYGNHEYVVNWQDDGKVVRSFGAENGGKVRSRPQNVEYYFKPSVSWSNVSSGAPAFRMFPAGFIAAGSTGDGVYPPSESMSLDLLGILNSTVTHELLAAIAPTITFNVGTVAGLPIIPENDEHLLGPVRKLVELARSDWDSSEMSWSFATNPLLGVGTSSTMTAAETLHSLGKEAAEQACRLEGMVNEVVADRYGLNGLVATAVDISRVSLSCNTKFRFSSSLSDSDGRRLLIEAAVRDLVSYAVGCMFGRFSIDQPGLILADQGATLQDYLARVQDPSFVPDADGVIPIVDGDWFEDDIVERFRQFLRAAFGDEHFEQNLQFVVDSLGVKSLRDYFVKSFYKDHVQRYKKRPIYWMFSSPKGSFNALIYMHRYTPSTASTVLNEYLREYEAKLKASLENAERANKAKEADRLRKVLVELAEYEHDVLYPLASQRIEIDLDDGVKVNYPKFGSALKKIPGLDAAE